MVPAYSNKDQVHIDSISNLVKEHKIGGIIFFQGGPVRQAHMINRYQRESKVPLMFSIDGEWGLAMRLDSTLRYPYQMALGAIQENELIEEMGAEIARQSRRAGIHINFAPVVDINNNANNPVIGFRSFGENKVNVAQKGLAYMRGMQKEKVLASAKHFPGHGDTNVDSHYGLPVIPFSMNRLEELELYPFRTLMMEGLGSVMVAHMHIPALDDTPNLASTLSPPIVTGLLKEDMGYKGLVFTDALNMQGVAKYYEPGVVDVKALLAGNDMLLNSMNTKATIREVKKALENGEITQEEIDKRVMKVLRAKAWLDLPNWQYVETEHLIEDLNSPYARHLSRKLAAKSLTVLRNEANIMPISHLKDKKIASISMGTDLITPFQKGLERYGNITHFTFPKDASLSDLNHLMEDIASFDLVIIGVHNLALRAGAGNFGISPEMDLAVKTIIQDKETIVSVFGNVYSLEKFSELPKAQGLLATYQETEDTQDLASQLIFGGIGANGRLPVNASSVFRMGDGIMVDKASFRMSYGNPEDLGLNSSDFKKIDSLVQKAIHAEAIPGASVLVAKEGKVIYQKAFGFHTYDSIHPVDVNDLYDMASITKISTALAALMHLRGEGKFDEENTLGEYLPMARGTNKEDLRYTDILTHQAGLQSWIPFWMSTVRKSGKFKWFTFKQDSSRRFPIRVAENLYIHRKYDRKIYDAIMDSPVNPEAGYVYSDLSFILAPLVVESISGKGFVDYLEQNLYQPLGAKSLTFNPYQRYPRERIVATERDTLFRKQVLHGTVHDEGAAMLGGVSGHAGLFGTAEDLAKLMHLYLYDGKYAGEQLIAPGVVTHFSKCKFCEEGNYRALGFDRPNKPGDPNGNAAASAPESSFGHSGFTGTYTWIDPENEIVYVFLSNRVYPTRENRKLYQLNIRTDIMEVVYEALRKAEEGKSGFF
jgi:beta-N-acetylhexosaminidase